MGGAIQQKELIPVRAGGSGEPIYEFRSGQGWVDDVNELTNSEHLPKIAKALVDALNAEAGLELPITILIDGKIDDPDDKLLGWLGLLPKDAIEKLSSVIRRAEMHRERHEKIGILFGLCFDPTIEGVQVAIPNVSQSGLIPVVITAGKKVLKLDKSE
jgi:hypothetical protein